MSNPWVEHVKKYAKDNNLSYRESMVQSKSSYKGKPQQLKRKKTKKTVEKLQKPKKSRKKINENDQEGSGILGDLYQGAKNKIANLLTARPLAVKNLISQYGAQGIQKIDICRQPITGVIKSAINVVTGGDLAKVVKEKGYDNVFHLFCVVNLDNGTKIRLDKNQRITIEVNPAPLNADAVCKSVTLPQKETLESFIDKGEKLGNQIGSFYRYSGWDNNCQKFIKALLNASGVTSLDSFIMQDAGEFIKPGLFRKITGVVTDTAALADYAYHGGKKRKRRPTGQRGRGRQKQTGCAKGCGDCGFCNG